MNGKKAKRLRQEAREWQSVADDLGQVVMTRDGKGYAPGGRGKPMDQATLAEAIKQHLMSGQTKPPDA